MSTPRAKQHTPYTPLTETSQRIFEAMQEGKTWGEMASNVEREIVEPLNALNAQLLAALKHVLPYLAHMGPIFDNPDLECGKDCPRCRAEAAIAGVEETK